MAFHSPGHHLRPGVERARWRSCKSDADQPVSALPTFPIHLSSTGMVNLPDPKKTVLLVCDVQERFRTFHASDPADSRRRYLELRCGRLDYAEDGEGCESGFGFYSRSLFGIRCAHWLHISRYKGEGMGAGTCYARTRQGFYRKLREAARSWLELMSAARDPRHNHGAEPSR